MLELSCMLWLPYSIAATMLLGISMSLYKLPAFKGYSSFLSTVWTNAFSAIFVLIILIAFNHGQLNEFSTVSWYALIWGGLFALTMVSQKIMLQNVETNSVFPITSSLGTITTVLLGITLFSEHISLIQGVGIIIIIVSVYLFSQKGGSFPLDKRNILLSSIIILSSSFSKYIQKLGATQDSITHFMTWQYIGAVVIGLIVALIFENNKFREIINFQKYWKGSFLIALFSTLGGYAILKALSLGPLSIVYSIHPAYILIAGFFGYIFFKEHLTKKKVGLGLLCVLGIIFLTRG